jgi:hypothetical protein
MEDSDVVFEVEQGFQDPGPVVLLALGVSECQF